MPLHVTHSFIWIVAGCRETTRMQWGVMDFKVQGLNRIFNKLIGGLCCFMIFSYKKYLKHTLIYVCCYVAWIWSIPD